VVLRAAEFCFECMCLIEQSAKNHVVGCLSLSFENNRGDGTLSDGPAPIVSLPFQSVRVFRACAVPKLEAGTVSNH
jgi:hypothetical protein